MNHWSLILIFLKIENFAIFLVLFVIFYGLSSALTFDLLTIIAALMIVS